MSSTVPTLRVRISSQALKLKNQDTHSSFYPLKKVYCPLPGLADLNHLDLNH